MVDSSSNSSTKVIRVDRLKWVNGGNINANNLSALLNEQGNMCCLGFACAQAAHEFGLPDIEVGQTTPRSYAVSIPPEQDRRKGILGALISQSDDNTAFWNSPLSGELADINDNKDLTPGERERLLNKYLKGHTDNEWEFEFYN